MNSTERMRLIYTKSGFYSSEPKRRGFFSLLSSMEASKVGWLEEEAIEELGRFFSQDGLLEPGKAWVSVKGEQLCALSEVHTLQLQAPQYQSGFFQMRLKSEVMVGPFYYQSGETQWPGEDILAMVQRFQAADQGRIAPKTREQAFREGLTFSRRREVWPFLLGVYPWSSTANERKTIDRELHARYERIKASWFHDSDKRQSKLFLEQEKAIEADLERTDRDQPLLGPLLEQMKHILIAYQLFNPLLPYSQGMSDILSPLMLVMQDEVLAFWTFVGFMDRNQYNFYAQLDEFRHLLRFMDPELYQALDRLGLGHLLFMFSWFLLWFKREFSLQRVMRLWEFLWSDWLTDKMLLFFALSMLKGLREQILTECHTPDDCLSYISRLSGQWVLDSQLERAELLFLQCKEKVETAQRHAHRIQRQLQIRSVWNSEKRYQLQQELDLLKIPEQVQMLFPS
ncbi:rab-GTPase-TBC domain-containing protein [Sporodiniella umbellata]|nr:rab-GTPase-TBC domain-containing protein [Sporodiniella umbellata]